MLVKIFASAIFGVSAKTIIVEVNIDQGVGYHLVGLPDSAIKESNFRINAALKNSNLKLPGKKITINMAPADLQKEGSAYDLPIAIGILAASEQVNSEQLHKFIMMGELSLDGSLRPIKGALPIAIQAKEEGFEGIILPKQNADEAAVVEGIDVFAVNNIRDIEGDSKVGKSTLAVRLGDIRARRFYMFLIFIAIFTGFTVSILASLAIIPAIGLLREIQIRKGKELIAVLGATGKFQLILGALIAVGTVVNI